MVSWILNKTARINMLSTKQNFSSSMFSSVPERHWDVLFVKKTIDIICKLPPSLYFMKKPLLSFFINILKINKTKYPFYWYTVAKNQIKLTSGFNKNKEDALLILDCLSPAPNNLDSAKHCKYRVPFWFFIVCYHNEDVFGWAKKSNVSIQSKSGGQSFLNISTLRKNISAIKWGVEQGLKINNTNESGLPLLVLAMQITNPSNDELVSTMDKLGACWDYKGSIFKSANQYLLENKEWNSWKVKRDLQKQTKDCALPRNKKRKF